MIEDFGLVISSAWDMMGMPITIYGFTFSWRNVMLWSLVAGILAYAVGRFFDD